MEYPRHLGAGCQDKREAVPILDIIARLMALVWGVSASVVVLPWGLRASGRELSALVLELARQYEPVEASGEQASM
ncbi:MAG: hypothetical protein J7M34_01895 [Anaerolineae bacterium]|nr:hypothetical protein [Anaerolineae bacterium]